MGERELTCREFVEFLDAYRSDELPRDERDRFEAHLVVCPDCVAYVKAYETTIAVTKAALATPDDPVGDTVPEELVRAILAARPRR